jgi:hypothetical protein
VDGDRPKAEVFTEIDKLLSELQEGETNKAITNGTPNTVHMKKLERNSYKIKYMPLYK